MPPPRPPTLRLALPLIILEFTQAKLCVCSWPSQEITSTIMKRDCGRTSGEFDVTSMAQAILEMDTEAISRHKEKATLAAQRYCAEHNRKTLMDIVYGMLNREPKR